MRSAVSLPRLNFFTAFVRLAFVRLACGRSTVLRRAALPRAGVCPGGSRAVNVGRGTPGVVLAPLAVLMVLASGVAAPALAQSPDQPAPAAGIDPIGAAGDGLTPLQGIADPIVASVEGHPIYLSELGEAAKSLPDSLRALPFDTLFPVLLDRMIDHEALVMMAKRQGLEDNKQIQQEIQAATERILEGAYLGAAAAPLVTEQAI